MTFDNGFVGSLAAGYDFANPLRVEVEIIRQKNDLDITSYNTNYGSFNEDDLKTRAFMFNGFYDVDTGSAWTPFVGVGMGWARLKINDPGFEDSDRRRSRIVTNGAGCIVFNNKSVKRS